MIKRSLRPLILDSLFQGKTIIIHGARQVGKTTLVHQILKDLRETSLFLNADEADTRSMLTDVNHTQLVPVFADYKIVVIDEAQRIPDIGLTLKIIHDNFPDIQLIATGSSSFELANKVNEPLTGRKFEYFLYPLSFNEMVAHHGFLTEKRLIKHRLVYGYYPDIVSHAGKELKLIKSLASSYLYKDLLMIEQIKKPVLLEKILKALALQSGNEVSYNELAQLLGSDKGTIEKYIDLLEKVYVIFRLNGFNRNVRNEIKKGKKIYFYDNGIRNAIIGNFTPFENRTDIGVLWENFLISERIKYLSNNEIGCQQFFWRTTQQQEIDYLEEYHDHFKVFEFKWNPTSRAAVSKTFSKAYPNHEFMLINPENIQEFLKG